MALSANSVFEVRVLGTDTNGGGFVTGAAGTDYSQQNGKNTATADISTTDAVANGTTTITSATAVFGTTIVGNIIYFSGGTGSIVGTWRQVTARASATSITIDSLIAASTGMTMNIGGALASPGQAAAIAAVGGQVIFIQAGTYTITTVTNNISGGCLSPGSGVKVVGYTATRTVLNTDARPTLILAAALSTATIVGAATCLVYNLILDGNSQTTSKGVAGNPVAIRCKFQNFTSTACACTAFFCEATGCSGASPFAQTSVFCVAHGNTIAGFAAVASYCVAYGNTGGTTDGFSGNTQWMNCVSYGNGRHGFASGGGNALVWANLIAEGNGGWGFNLTSDGAKATFNLAHWNNTSGGVSFGLTPKMEFGSIALGATPFVAAASQDFRLNSAAAGLLCRAAGFPADWSSLSLAAGLDYADIGAFQHQDAGGGGPVGTNFRGGFSNG